MTSGKHKGSAFERTICKSLSEWVSGGKRQDLFWRSAMSGGRATVGRRKGQDLKHHAGDISATHPLGHLLTDYWYVECKFYKDLRIQHALLAGEGELARFWREANQQAADHERQPMLIAKQNGLPILMLVPAPHMLTQSHMMKFSRPALIARLHTIGVDMYLFDRVMQEPFIAAAAQPIPLALLQPGELPRIMAGTMKSSERIRINKRVRINR